ncbi:Pre-mRNA-splicing factor RBM22 [Bienertia sinuspersici]
MATRLYVGGLGERVTEEDLRKTFSHLGAIETVDIIRTKNRSFAYINFLPSSENSLPKLFSKGAAFVFPSYQVFSGIDGIGKCCSELFLLLKWFSNVSMFWLEPARGWLKSFNQFSAAKDQLFKMSKCGWYVFQYNGCLWKGGKLKLEKAKEHYIDRLKREWAEDAELINCEDTNDYDVDVNMTASLAHKSTLDLEKMQLRMFFPKLRKVKSLPFRGTGKHKYSFQRLAVPPLPVHFCDCPEHFVDIKNHKVNAKGTNITSSVMNNNRSNVKNRCFQPSRGAQVDDSRIQDDGLNDEEIHVMNSVIKKLLARESAKSEQQNLHDSPQLTAAASELQEDKDKTDEETDDDDIKINTGTGQDFGSESWETSLVKMARSNEQQASGEPAKSKLGTRDIKLPLCNKKRKSVVNDRHEKDSVSHIPRKKVHFETQSKESEGHLELKSVTESDSVTKKSISSGIWSQKSSWKELIGDRSSGSFYLSLGGVTNNVEQPISDGEASTDSKKHKNVNDDLHEEHKPSNKTLSDERERVRVSTSVQENLDAQLKDREELEAAQLESGPSAGIDEATKGSSWLQKSSWTKLLHSGESSSFSLSQILPKDQLEKQKLNKSNYSTTLNNFYGSGAGFGGTRSSRSGLVGKDKKKDAQASKGNVKSDSTISKKSDLKQVSNSLPGVEINETCPFMRSADSLKDWQTAKTALTSALKKRNSSKQGSV